MGVTSKCPGAECCNDPVTKAWRGCYDPTKCEACVNGVVVQNDPDLLAKDCKECLLVDPIGGVVSICADWEGCCYGECYNLVCEQCNHVTKRKEDKCAVDNKMCCKNSNGTNAECYDPKQCKICDCDSTGKNCSVKDKSCEALECCNGSGDCYDPKCDTCASDGKVTKKCKPNEQCCVDNNGNFVDCYNPSQCKRCVNGVITDTRNQAQIDQCYECDPSTGIPYLGGNCVPSSRCCGGICMTDCQKCVNGNVEDDCPTDSLCCDNECIPKDPSSSTTCKACVKDNNNNLTVIENKCSSRTDGKTSCCGGVCFDNTCHKCSNGSIIPDSAKDSSASCCGGHKLQFGEFCCKDGLYGKREVYTAPYSCCANTLGDTGIYNPNIQGCCKYGTNDKNTIYDILTEKCCPDLDQDYKVISKTYRDCCGTTTIDKFKEKCCTDATPNYSVKQVCEDCNNGSPLKKYDETKCEECRSSRSVLSPDFIAVKCTYNTNGKTTCCEGSGDCYNPNGTCENCLPYDDPNGVKTAILGPKCPDPSNPDPLATSCCNGECYNPNDCDKQCYQTPNDNGDPLERLEAKCPPKVWSQSANKFFATEPRDILCCNGECIDDSCYKCDSNVKESRCPGTNSPSKFFCCPGQGCYNSCEQCLAYNDPITNNTKFKIVPKGVTIDRSNGNITGNDGSCSDCCENGSIATCCKTTCCNGQCCPDGQVCCEDTCVSKDSCCNGSKIDNDTVCCGGQPYPKSVCNECCGGVCIDSSRQCCNKGQPNEYDCAIDSFCCGDTCCAKPCCNGICCADDPIKGAAECCSGPSGSVGGGCYFPFDCEQCTNGTVTTTLKSGESCCDGVPFSPRNCEKCINGVKTPYTPPNSNCYCYAKDPVGIPLCGCPLTDVSIEVDTEGTGHCCDAAIFSVILISHLSGIETNIGTVNLNNGDSCIPPHRTLPISQDTAKNILNNLVGGDCCQFRIRLDCAISGDAGFGPGQCHTSIANGRVIKTQANGQQIVAWQGLLDSTGNFNICDESIIV